MISAWLIAIRGAFSRCRFRRLGVSLIAAPPVGFGLGCFTQLLVARPYRSKLLDATQCAKITLVLRHDYPGQVCSIAKSLEVVGERWSLLIVRDVMNGRRRFDELQKAPRRRPQRALRPPRSAWSRRTSSSGAPTRAARQRYEYFLTEKGLDLWPALIALLGWGDRHSTGPGRTADADRPQGVRRRGQRPRHLRELRRGAERARRAGAARSRRRCRALGTPPRRLRASVGCSASWRSTIPGGDGWQPPRSFRSATRSSSAASGSSSTG